MPESGEEIEGEVGQQVECYCLIRGINFGVLWHSRLKITIMYYVSQNRREGFEDMHHKEMRKV
jgi:hypothetical protein